MSKKQRMPRNQQLYRRPTKAFQQNIAKNDPRMQMPEMPSRRKTLAINITAAVIVVVLFVLGIKFLGWWAGLIVILGGFVYLVIYMRYMNGKQKELFAKYQEMGIPKKMFMKQLEQNGVKPTNMAAYVKIWDRVAQGENYKQSLIDKLMGF